MKDNKPETLQLRDAAEGVARLRDQEVEAAMSALYALHGSVAPRLEQRLEQRFAENLGISKPSGGEQPAIDLEQTRQAIADTAPGGDAISQQRMVGSNGMSQELTNA